MVLGTGFATAGVSLGVGEYLNRTYLDSKLGLHTSEGRLNHLDGHGFINGDFWETGHFGIEEIINGAYYGLTLGLALLIVGSLIKRKA